MTAALQGEPRQRRGPDTIFIIRRAQKNGTCTVDTWIPDLRQLADRDDKLFIFSSEVYFRNFLRFLIIQLKKLFFGKLEHIRD